MKRVIILGSTGSIGTQALDVIREYKGEFEVEGLCCNGNVSLLQKQIDEFKPRFVAVKDENAAKTLTLDKDVTLFVGDNAAEKIASCRCDLVLNALVGISGLLPTVNAIDAGSDIALANKETLVAGGEIVMEQVRLAGVKILPVDSEHSAIWQCLDRNADNARNIESILLTASGGPFRGRKKSQLLDVTIDDALRHPTWNMGVKVTVDSATMMNKGFEVIEAMHLFGVRPDNIQVVVHRQSVVHSMVRYADGSITAQMSYPDMKLPIALALLYPERGSHCFEKLDFSNLTLDFENPDLDTFECLDIALKCAQKGGAYNIALNAANEIAVEYFVKRQIKFYDMPYYIKQAVQRFCTCEARDAQSVVALDGEIKDYVRQQIRSRIG